MEVLTVIAILLGPILAVQAQKWVEVAREKRNRRLLLFKRLMATRGAQVSPAHVEALNMIDLEFSGRGEKDKVVRDRWKQYLDHLNSLPQDPAQRERQVQGWLEENSKLLADLLHDMGKPLGYDFDVTHIRRAVYIPVGHANLEIELQAIRQFLVALSENRKKLPVSVRNESEQLLTHAPLSELNPP